MNTNVPCCDLDIDKYICISNKNMYVKVYMFDCYMKRSPRIFRMLTNLERFNHSIFESMPKDLRTTPFKIRGNLCAYIMVFKGNTNLNQPHIIMNTCPSLLSILLKLTWVSVCMLTPCSSNGVI